MMSRLHRITLGDATFHARSGQNLLEAALSAGVDLPHDCRAGRCGTCLTRVCNGITLGGDTFGQGMVHACRAMVFSDLSLEVEPRPPVVSLRGRVSGLSELARDIVEVAIMPEKPLAMLPGQYCRFRFRGYAARSFSPTAPLAAMRNDGLLRLQVKRVAGGRVTPQLGKAIGRGHQVQIEGPLGTAYLRAGSTGRLVLVGSGTGFAPIWAVAQAALREDPARSLELVAASRTLDAFYMAPALMQASRFAGTRVKAVISELEHSQGRLLAGQPLEHLPHLQSGDTVYAAGAPGLVEAVGTAAAAGAAFHADPFETPRPTGPSLAERALSWLSAG
ncbi:MAG: 2Fe-2S iron-sulfur cluster binding domain-containing protein [Hyphomicrobiaceae bacterium]